jgi:hypothetical protein
MRETASISIPILFVASILAQAQAKHSAESIVARAKSSDVSRLDSRLPRQRFYAWFKNVVGPMAKIRWEANDCGEQTGGPADKVRDLPICAQAEAELSDGRKVVVSIAVGTMKKGLTREPGGMYYSVVEQGDKLDTIKRLGDLPEMLRAKAR